MKKILLIAVMLLTFIGADAQVRFGIKGGVNFNSMSDIKIGDLKNSFDNRSGFNAGILVQAKSPVIGLAIQPELLYTSKGAMWAPTSSDAVNEVLDAKKTIRMDYLELPVNIQWGLDLLVLRPYIQVSPYVSYAISKKGDIADVEWNNLNRFDYGVGLGAGVEIWKFQISGKYSWSLGTLSDFKNDIPELGIFAKDKINGAKMRGFELSLAFLF